MSVFQENINDWRFEQLSNVILDKSKYDFEIDFWVKYPTTDPEIALKTFLDLFTPVIDKHIPLKTRRVKHQNLPTWLTVDIIKEMQLRDNIKQNKTKKTNELKTFRNTILNTTTNVNTPGRVTHVRLVKG